MQGSTILVVGAGIAGLQTARALLKRGFDVLVLEQTDDIGGLWSKRYHGANVGMQGMEAKVATAEVETAPQASPGRI